MSFFKLDKYCDQGLLILRIGLGAMFVYHGAPKLMAGPVMWEKLGMAIGALGIHFFPVFWGFMSVMSEFGGGLLLIGGLLFQPACLFLLINMVVATSMHLSMKQGLPVASHAIEDGIMFLSLIFIGPGKLSLDHWLRHFRKK